MSATKRRWERQHLQLDRLPIAPIKPRILHHPCGQPLRVEDTTVGYCTFPTFWVGNQGYRDCPGCGKRIRFGALIHPNDMAREHCRECGAPTLGLPLCAGCINFLDSEYLDHQDTLASLRATW